MTTTERWPKEDRIRWVEERLRDRVAQESGRAEYVDLPEEFPGRKSLEVWLAKERDGQSWQQIVIKHFPEYVKRKTPSKSAGISRARRAYMLVERALEPSRKSSLRWWLDERIKEVFGCTPKDFKKYLSSI